MPTVSDTRRAGAAFAVHRLEGQAKEDSGSSRNCQKQLTAWLRVSRSRFLSIAAAGKRLGHIPVQTPVVRVAFKEFPVDQRLDALLDDGGRWRKARRQLAGDFGDDAIVV